MDSNYEVRLVDEAGREYHAIDKEGNISMYRLYQGHKYSPKHFPPSVPERLEEIANMECRDDDVLLSTYPKSAVCDSWFDHVKMWGPAMKQYPKKDILFLSYESMKENLYESVMKIVKFLGVERSEEFCKEVERKCTFSNMKPNVNKGRKPEEEWLFTAEGGILPIYRKGEVGDWKNWFTVAQSEKFDALYEQELKDYDISCVYTPRNL